LAALLLARLAVKSYHGMIEDRGEPTAIIERRLAVNSMVMGARRARLARKKTPP